MKNQNYFLFASAIKGSIEFRLLLVLKANRVNEVRDDVGGRRKLNVEALKVIQESQLSGSVILSNDGIPGEAGSGLGSK